MNKFNAKTKFLFLGTINVLICNLFLQYLLLLDGINIAASTFLAQSLNVVIGYIFYGSIVFQKKNLYNNLTMRKYVMCITFLWLINFLFITILSNLGIHKNIAAIILIPFLALISYSMNKWTFDYKRSD